MIVDMTQFRLTFCLSLLKILFCLMVQPSFYLTNLDPSLSFASSLGTSFALYLRPPQLQAFARSRLTRYCRNRDSDR